MKGYFVSMINGKRTALLVGPYATHQEALAMVDKAKEKAIQLNLWCVFYTFGTCKIESDSLPTGKLNEQLEAANGKTT